MAVLFVAQSDHAARGHRESWAAVALILLLLKFLAHRIGRLDIHGVDISLLDRWLTVCWKDVDHEQIGEARCGSQSIVSSVAWIASECSRGIDGYQLLNPRMCGRWCGEEGECRQGNRRFVMHAEICSNRCSAEDVFERVENTTGVFYGD